ncbi:MAG: single-stranded DNA-binding protein [Oligoflexia bacterium]|nr:single-stranded DNA-binding protein [Oligoflexia bacterium]MBF0364549.1 single-stranded DNA-binding protein [Oligoflexia bacterium]
MSLNKVMLLGRLGQNPELKYTASGAPVCNFTLATSETWKDKNNGQKMEKTEWHRIVVWSKLAEHCNQYLTKGRQVFIEGTLRTRAWNDKDGVKRYTTEVLANTVQFIGASAGATAGANVAAGASAGGSADMMMDGGFNDSDFYPPFEDGARSSGSSSNSNSNSNNNNRDKGYNIPANDQFSPDELPF